jgi:hypothetical protein
MKEKIILKNCFVYADNKKNLLIFGLKKGE